MVESGRAERHLEELQDSLCPSQDSKWALPEYRSGALQFESTYSANSCKLLEGPWSKILSQISLEEL